MVVGHCESALHELRADASAFGNQNYEWLAKGAPFIQIKGITQSRRTPKRYVNVSIGGCFRALLPKCPSYLTDERMSLRRPGFRQRHRAIHATTTRCRKQKLIQILRADLERLDSHLIALNSPALVFLPLGNILPKA